MQQAHLINVEATFDAALDFTAAQRVRPSHLWESQASMRMIGTSRMSIAGKVRKIMGTPASANNSGELRGTCKRQPSRCSAIQAAYRSASATFPLAIISAMRAKSLYITRSFSIVGHTDRIAVCVACSRFEVFN